MNKDTSSETHIVDEDDGKASRIGRDGLPRDGLSSGRAPVLALGGRGHGDGLDGESEEGCDGEELGEHL